MTSLTRQEARALMPQPTEDQIQRELLGWLKAVCPNALVFAVPNGEHRNKRTAAKLKGQGVLPGAPDLVVAHDGVIAFIEVKRPKGRQSPAQIEFQDRCAEQRLPYGVVRGKGDLKAFLDDIGIRTREAA